MRRFIERYSTIADMDKTELINKLTQYKSLLTKYFDLDCLILFGSYAKGTQREESDIDVAVIVNSIQGVFFTYAPLLWKLRREIDDRIEPILIDKNDDVSGFLHEIKKNGIVIN